MSLYMRFIFGDGPAPGLGEIGEALRTHDPAFELLIDPLEPVYADLLYDGELYAELETNAPGDDLFDEDIEELAVELGKQDDPNAAIPLVLLRRARGMLALHVLRAGHADFERLEPLFEWLFTARDGLLQIDQEGFFNREGRVVALL